jgi:hypothetical protein
MIVGKLIEPTLIDPTFVTHPRRDPVSAVEDEMNSTQRRKGAKSPGKAHRKFSLRLCAFASLR